jgi:hypothetical protein
MYKILRCLLLIIPKLKIISEEFLFLHLLDQSGPGHKMSSFYFCISYSFLSLCRSKFPAKVAESHFPSSLKGSNQNFVMNERTSYSM